MPNIGHVAAVIGTVQKFINQFGSFVRVLAVEERGSYFGGWNVAGDVEVDTTQELGIVGTRRRTDLLGCQAFVDLVVDPFRQVHGRESLSRRDGMDGGLLGCLVVDRDDGIVVLGLFVGFLVGGSCRIKDNKQGEKCRQSRPEGPTHPRVLHVHVCSSATEGLAENRVKSGLHLTAVRESKADSTPMRVQPHPLAIVPRKIGERATLASGGRTYAVRLPRRTCVRRSPSQL